MRCSLNVNRTEYSTARNGGKLFREFVTDNNGLASYLPVWTKPTSCADSISAGRNCSEVRRTPIHIQRTPNKMVDSKIRLGMLVAFGCWSENQLTVSLERKTTFGRSVMRSREARTAVSGFSRLSGLSIFKAPNRETASCHTVAGTCAAPSRRMLRLGHARKQTSHRPTWKENDSALNCWASWCNVKTRASVKIRVSACCCPGLRTFRRKTHRCDEVSSLPNGTQHRCGLRVQIPPKAASSEHCGFPLLSDFFRYPYSKGLGFLSSLVSF